MPRPLHSHHVIVVEGDVAVREVVGGLLAEMGYRVTLCGSALEARSVMAWEEVNLLLSDERMIGESGHEWADHAQRAGVPTLLMSADNVIKEELGDGLHDFIGKPFRFTELRERVGTAIELSERDASRELRR
jgi:two-component system, OmpR family, phosphate regulon response regulator OmpR